MAVESETLSSKRAAETILVSAYPSGTQLNVESTSDFNEKEAFTITDGTNREYFIAAAISGSYITISGSGLENTYAADSIVQRIFERDPSAELATPYETVDELIRFQLRSMANQIDFS